MKKLNIYFDIAGVLLWTNSPKEDIIELLEYCLSNYPNSTYWLTTYCMGGNNRTNYALQGKFPNELVERVYNTFLPTDWHSLKTEAIDFNSDFVWFDDNLSESDKVVLEENHALDGFFRMNPQDPEMAKKALRFLMERG